MSFVHDLIYLNKIALYGIHEKYICCIIKSPFARNKFLPHQIIILSELRVTNIYESMQMRQSWQPLCNQPLLCEHFRNRVGEHA